VLVLKVGVQIASSKEIDRMDATDLDLPPHVSRLSPQKREALERILTKQDGNSREVCLL
jgi:hypothetical protein